MWNKNKLANNEQSDIYIDNGSTPVAEKISRGRSGPYKAPNIIPFIKCTPDYLPAKGPRCTNN